MTAAELKRAHSICDAAVPGDWFADERGWITVQVPGDDRSGMEMELLTRGADGTYAELRFAAESRTLLPAALDEIERLRGLLGEACEIAEDLCTLATHSERTDDRLAAIRAAIEGSK